MSFSVCVTVHASLPPVVDWRRRPASVKDALNSAPRASSSHGPAPTTTVAVDGLSGTCVVASRQRAFPAVHWWCLDCACYAARWRWLSSLSSPQSRASRRWIGLHTNLDVPAFGAHKRRRVFVRYMPESDILLESTERVKSDVRNWFFTVGREDCTRTRSGRHLCRNWNQTIKEEY